MAECLMHCNSPPTACKLAPMHMVQGLNLFKILCKKCSFYCPVCSLTIIIYSYSENLVQIMDHDTCVYK